MSARLVGRRRLALPIVVIGLTGCQTPLGGGPSVPINYVGSSTIAIFLRDADPLYRGAEFRIDTEPESEGGERAIVEGRTDLAGTARQPRPETLRAGIAATLIGRDAIAIIVNARNPVTNLTLSDAKAIFTGTVRNWTDLGGPDLPIQPFIVSPESATRGIFRTTVLDGEEYAGCQEIRPDRDIIAAVARVPGGIGHISFSFLNGATGVRPVAVEGEAPSVTNFDYPVARPLYLLWREQNSAVESFVRWTQGADGQRVVMQHFVGIRVQGSLRGPERGAAATGRLIVYTETYPVYDGGIYYYPHRPYTVLTRHGVLIRRVRNHRGENDERPTPVDLAPGTYLIRPESSRGPRPEYFVTIKAGQTTDFNVEALLRGGP